MIQRFKEVLKKIKIKPTLRLSNKPQLNDQLNEYNVEIRTPGLYGTAMYEELSQHYAYLFIGNGDADTSYINKTLYDASIGRTVFLIYKKVDCYGQFSELKDYYFSNSTELAFKTKWIQKDYQSHLKIQKDFLYKHLSKEILDF